MPEFLELLPPQEALAKLLQQLQVTSGSEKVDTSDALGKVLAEDIQAPYPLPSFPRSTVDGYAVKAADTFGASDSLPAYLRVVGEIAMGAQPDKPLGKAECLVIHTGGMLPEGADAVVMIEYTQTTSEAEIEIYRPVAVGENVLQVGEDVQKGEVVLPRGTILRPAEIGGLMALGVTQVIVSRPPKVGVISSGDEVIPPDGELQAGQVRDVNSYSLSALVSQVGGLPVRYGIVTDDAQALKFVADRALQESDMLVITAGSSASVRDLTAQVINQLGSPGVLVHGVSIRPGKPTILGICNHKPVIGLPGNPVSALVAARLFVVTVLERLLGIEGSRPRGVVMARLTVNLASQSGREDWIGVRLLKTSEGFDAEPIFGRSNFIFSLVRADGMICIPPAATGLESGELVEVQLL